MRSWTWFLLSCKRQMKHVFFVVMLCLMPLLLFSFHQLEAKDSGKILIGIYSEDAADEITEQVMEELLNQNGMFQFYICESKQELKDDVAARRAECGYVFTEKLKQKLDDKRFKRSIEVYSAPSTITGELSKEVVFSCLIEVYGEDILGQFIADGDLFVDFSQDEVVAELQDKYREQRGNGSTFSFQYETVSAEIIEQGTGNIAFPIRGMVAIYLFIVGLFSAAMVSQDEQNGLFIPLPTSQQVGCKLAVLAAPVVLAGISGLLALLITGEWTNVWKEVCIGGGYAAAITVWGYLCKVLIKDAGVICGLIPFFILGSIIFCPVFFDIAIWISQTGWIRYLFLPYYYIRCF